MQFRAPLDEISFVMAQAQHWGRAPTSGAPEFADGAAEAVLREAARFADEKLSPLNAVGDRVGARFKDGTTETAPGWRDAYTAWRAGGWAGIAAPARFGGSGLPRLLGAACLEMWNGANVAFMLGPLLSFAAIDALAAHATPNLQKLFLEKIVAGEWTATMNLTEPQAGSDLSDLKTRAVPAGDGRYRIFGQKIFITYGDHDLTENIVHLVLARLPDAPAGTRGLSLFLTPKVLVERSGAIGARNDLRCAGIEHKLGIHGAPTCTMIFGEQEGATAWLVGEENKGLACMFTMMNNARLAVGLQGVGLCEAATQAALVYARERRQGRAPGTTSPGPSPLVAHPDVRRMLLTMKASTAAARAICYLTAAAIDAGEGDDDDACRSAERGALLTPVAKAFSTDLANEVASLCVQVHGGMGYIEESGVAQLMRDARIAAIYEGANGIQAIDLALRKLPLRKGQAVREEIAAMRASLSMLSDINEPAFGATALRLGQALDSLERATHWMLAAVGTAHGATALAGATPYLRLFGLARGGVLLADLARASPTRDGRIELARFFAENMAVASSALEAAIVTGAESVLTADAALMAAS